MQQHTTVTFNVEKQLKDDAKKYLKKRGIDLSTALRLFMDGLRKDKYHLGFIRNLEEKK